VVGSACSTATGAFDPLEATADFCEAHGLWFHVDGGARGGGRAQREIPLAPEGVERADSVGWDTHRMPLMPALATAVLFRDGARSY
jgi:L-2,4-diaminobutyrate decarboxylase